MALRAHHQSIACFFVRRSLESKIGLDAKIDLILVSPLSFWKRIIVSSYQNVQNVGTVHHAIFNFFGFRVCSPVKQIFDNPQSVKAFYSISEESILSAVTLLWEYPCVLSYTCWALEFAEGAPNSP